MNTIEERIDVSRSGVSIVPTKEEFEKIRFLAPNSSNLISLQRTKAARRAPSRIQSGALRDRRLQMIAPIPIELERKHGQVLARWDEIEEFGYGKNISEALDDFTRTRRSHGRGDLPEHLICQQLKR